MDVDKPVTKKAKGPTTTRREKGKTSKNVAPYRKGYWKRDKSENTSQPTEPQPTDSATSSSSDASMDASQGEVSSHCEKPFHEPHLCSDSEVFSSGFYTETETEQSKVVEKRKQRKLKTKKFLAYQRKTTKGFKTGVLNIVGDCGDSDSDISIPSDLSLSEIDVETVEETGANDASDVNVDVCDDDKPTVCDLKTVASSLKDNLKILLCDEWSVSIVDGILRIMIITTSKNPLVEKSIYYDIKEKAVGIHIHGVALSPENRVFKCHYVPESENIGSISDFLKELTERVKIMNVCEGIKENQELWDVQRGFLDYSSVLSPHYRHGNCHLLIKSPRKICIDCQEEVKRIERELKRREKHASEVDSTPDKYLSLANMKRKKDSYRKKFREEKAKSTRLEQKVESLLIKLDAALHDDLTAILSKNQHKMTDLQRLFWQQQRLAFSLSDPRGMRWHPMMVRIALHLHSLSDSAYSFMNELKILVLPCKRRLYDYSHFIDPKEGCQEEFINSINEKIRNSGEEAHFSFVNLMFDEMHIKAGLVVRRSTGELIGYTQLDDCEEELRKMKSDLTNKTYKPVLAKKVLAFMANGITSLVKDIVAIYSTDDLSASQLYDRTWDVIYNLEEAGIKVLCVTCDGASVNRKFIYMHESIDKDNKFVYCTRNLVSGDMRPLFFIVDPPHLLKTIRNALANSFCHKRTRKLWKNNQFMSWKVIELLFELTSGDKFRQHKLTKAHIKLTSFSCMTVLFATQVMSNSVANCIEFLVDHAKMQLLDTDELIKFIRLVNRFFDCVNGKEEVSEEEQEKEREEIAVQDINEASGQDCENIRAERREKQHSNPDKAPYTSPSDLRLSFLENEFLGYCKEWMADIDQRPGIFSDSEKNQMIISHQSLGALEITVRGIVGAMKFMLQEAGARSVCARVFNQDPLEQYFSKVRRSRGDSNNPTLKAVHDIRLDLHAQGLVSVASLKGNTEVQKRKAIEVDHTPLPVRAVKRKPK